jgi:hypothetical protein
VSFDAAKKVADAVLFEGYLLYPYRSTAQKNQVRWQFGVLAPTGYAEAAGETSFSQTELLMEAGAEAAVDLRVRFLQLQTRAVERACDDGFAPVDSLVVDNQELVTWDEGVERDTEVSFELAQLMTGEQEFRFHVAAGRDVESVLDATGRDAGRIVRERRPVDGVVRACAQRTAGPFGAIRVRIRVENTTDGVDPSTSRDVALCRALVSTHLLAAVDGGRFISLLDPPEWARDDARSCVNLHTYPVLVDGGEGGDVILSSPIILYDHPEIAPESAGELFDGTEIDEILTLRTMALTNEEKQAARATDPRAAAIVDRVDTMPGEWLERLHGAIRSVAPASAGSAGPAEPEVPWWDPGRDASVSPETDSVRVGSVALARGSRVRLCPGAHRADAQDMFLDGRAATVEAVLNDVDDKQYLAVSLDDDPASELLQWHGRFLYFSPDEVRPL